MKTFCITSLLCFVLFSSASFAQSNNQIEASNIETLKEQKRKPVSGLEQSQYAIKYLKQQIQEEVAYPEKMLEKNIEGQVVVKVMIAKSSKIASTSIAKSKHEGFNEEVLNALKDIKKIKSKLY